MSCVKPMKPWFSPKKQTDETLVLYNSLTRSKVPFVPIHGNQILWYTCGPTVYDVSHVGHARNYLTFDIVRRILQNYFNYDVLYVMNITDIDDKIILRARRNHLFQKYLDTASVFSTVLQDVKTSLQLYRTKMHSLPSDDLKRDMMAKIVASIEEQLKKTQENPAPGRELWLGLIKCAQDPLSEMLDQRYGKDVNDHEIFSRHTAFYEADFLSDMKALNVLPADVLTRVSEYVPEIVKFVEKIISNGFAYESSGSVYFDTLAFANHDQHEYAKLVPEAFGNAAALAEGEGELVSDSHKRSPNDFALWKSSKPGEPFWQSPWGAGRPGWHIECSCMAGEILGSRMDIHSGGIDLKFPHHDNELAQSEAYYENPQWVNYFLHGGHLEIEGKKMSKSLKNFTTIKEALQRYSARQLRIMFLLHSWSATLDYSANTMQEAVSFERIFNEYFMNVKALLRELPPRSVKYAPRDVELLAKLRMRKAQVHSALLDSLDTCAVMRTLKEIVSDYNIYLRETPYNPDLLKAGAVYITRILKIFGCVEADAKSAGGDSLSTFDASQIGFDCENHGSGSSQEQVLIPFLQAFSTFRDDVRELSRVNKNLDALKLCDHVRDEILPELGVKLEDREGARAVVKLADRESLLRERQQAKLLEEEKKRKKEEAKRKQEEIKAKKEAQKRIPPQVMFLDETDKFSKFDADGIPTHDSDGVELTKNKRKGVEKLFEQQKKIYQEFLNQQQNQ